VWALVCHSSIMFINPIELYWIATINKYFNMCCATFQSSYSFHFINLSMSGLIFFVVILMHPNKQVYSSVTHVLVLHLMFIMLSSCSHCQIVMTLKCVFCYQVTIFHHIGNTVLQKMYAGCTKHIGMLFVGHGLRTPVI
jgi:hypothetical protein